MRARSVLALLAFLVAALVGPAPLAEAAGTSVCGTLPAGVTTVWTALNSPYEVCSSGVVIPSDATLAIDGTVGPVSVRFDYNGFIQAAGALRTQNTSPTNNISFAPTDSGSWSIRSAGCCTGPESAGITLANASLVGGAIEAVAHSFSLQASSLRDNPVQVFAPNFTVDRSSFTFGAPCKDTNYGPQYGVQLLRQNPLTTSPGDSGTFTSNTVQGGCAADLSGGQMRVTGNEIDGVQNQPPLSVLGTYTLGPIGSVSSNSGAGDAKPWMDLGGTAVGGFTWVPVPPVSSSSQTLGYVGDGLSMQGPGTLTIPANITVAATNLGVQNGSLDASAGGDHFACPDPTVACGLVLGLGAGGSGTVRGATIDGDFYVAGTSGSPASLSFSNSSVHQLRSSEASATIDSSHIQEDVLATADSRQTLSVTNSVAQSVQVQTLGSGTANVSSNQNVGFIAADQLQGGAITITNNTMIGPGDLSGPGRFPAIFIEGDALRLGPGSLISGNQATGFDSDSIEVAGSLAPGDTQWLGARRNPTLAPMGYLVDMLTVPTGATLTTSPGASLKFGTNLNPFGDLPGRVLPATLLFAGGSLDASAGGASFEGLQVQFEADAANNPAHGVIESATAVGSSINYYAPGYAPGATSGSQTIATPALTIHGLRDRPYQYPLGASFGATAISIGSFGAPLDASGLVLRGAPQDSIDYSGQPVVQLVDANGSTIDQSVVYGNVFSDGLDARDSKVRITNSRFTQNPNGWGVRLDGGSLVASCDEVDHNYGGISDQLDTDSANASVTSSNLVGNSHAQAIPRPQTFDLQGPGALPPLQATQNWWGQPGGPQSDQVSGQVVTAPALLASSPCADAAPGIPAPAPVADLTETASTSAATLKWTDPGDPDITGVQVQMVAGSQPPSSPQDGTTVYSGSVGSLGAAAANLQPGTTYSFTVFSKSAYTDAMSSASITLTTATNTTPSPTPTPTAAARQAPGLQPAQGPPPAHRRPPAQHPALATVRRQRRPQARVRRAAQTGISCSCRGKPRRSGQALQTR